MAVTETSICNSALAKLGAKRIASLDEDSKEARLCKEQYSKLRNEVLRSHPWNFAIKRAALALDTASPAYGFDNYFVLPSDFLRILDTEYLNEKYKIENNGGNRRIATDAATINARYIAEVTTTALFSADFAEVLAWRIAADLAYAIVQSRGVAQDIFASYQWHLRNARSYDAQEGSPDSFIADTWITSRSRGTFFGAGEF